MENALTTEILRTTMAPLAPLLEDPTVTDIMVYGPDRIFVRRQGQRFVHYAGRWERAEDLEICVSSMARFVRRRLDSDNPILDSRLPDGSRINVISKPCYQDGACVAIRLFPKERIGVPELLRYGTLDEAGIEVIRAAIQAGRNVLISGGTGSGKTTLLNCIAGYIPDGEVVVSVEDSREIQLRHALWAPLEAKKAVHEDDREISLRDLVRNALRMNPRWIIVGEVRGPEALDLIRAFNTGHSGLGTIHSNSASDALLSLESLIFQATDIPSRAVKEMVSRAIHLVVQISLMPDQTRRITEIIEVAGLDYTSPHIPYSTRILYQYQPTGVVDGRIQGSFQLGDRPEFLKALAYQEDLVPEFWR